MTNLVILTTCKQCFLQTSVLNINGNFVRSILISSQITKVNSRNSTLSNYNGNSTEFRRWYSSKFSANKMAAWQIHQYGGPEELTFNQTAKAATIQRPNEVRVKVHASSVNPIDVRMTETKTLSRFMKESEFPIILGRDFSGTVIETGRNVHRFRVGDEVWGALSAQRPGTHAQLAVTAENEISLKPANISHIEAASLPYVALTTWAALCNLGQLREKDAEGKRLLVLGVSGGMGAFAIQLGRAWGMQVTTSCRSDAFDLVTRLGAEQTFDYSEPDFWEQLGRQEKFDLILDTVGGYSTAHAIPLLKPCDRFNPEVWHSKLVMLNSDLLRNINGLTDDLPEVLKPALKLIRDRIRELQSVDSVRRAVFMPSGKAMDEVRRMVESEQISPVVQEVFPFSEAPAAYQKVSDGHLRGKIVIDTCEDGSRGQ